MDRLDRRPLFLATALLVLVAVLGVVVRGMNVVTRSDADIVSWVAQHRSSWLVDVARILTYLGNGAVVAIALIVIAVVLVRGRVLSIVEATAPLVALGLGVVLSTIGKQIVQRPRPPAGWHEVVERSSGFPSGHSTQAAAGWLALALVLVYARRSSGQWRRYPIVAALLVIGLVGITRVILGVHSPTDVLAGWALGSACALVVVAFLYRGSRPSDMAPG